MKRICRERFYRLFYPQPAFVIVAWDGREVSALTATWAVPLSFMPPYAGVLVSPERYTYKVLKSSKYFTINMLDFSFSEQASFLGNTSKRFLPSKLESSGLNFVKKEGYYYVAEASAYVLCKREREVEIGDHDLFIGKVVDVFATDAFDDLWDLKKHKPMLYFGSLPGKGYSITRIFQTSTGFVKVKEPRIKEFYERFEKEMEILRLAKKFGPEIKRIAELVGLDEEDVQLILEEMKRQGKIEDKSHA